jgi:hypothetical protein
LFQLGIRDGLELGKEDTLQEGFDDGFALGAARSFRFGRLRGALGAASACGLFSVLNSDQVRDCMKQLRTLEMDTSIHKDGEENASSSSEAESAVKQAQELLQSIELEISSTSSK